MFTPPPPPPPCVEEHMWPEDSYQDDKTTRAVAIRANGYVLKESLIRDLKKDYARNLATRGQTRCGWSSVRHSVSSRIGPAVAVATPVIDVKQRFRRLANEWEKEIGNASSLTAMTKHPKYKQIVNLGWDAVPFMLSDLQQSRGFWFPALNEITGIQPFDLSDAGNSKRMIEAWVKWGKRKKLI
jgi:hypothetical protein